MFPCRQNLRIREILMTASTGLLSAVASAGATLFALHYLHCLVYLHLSKLRPSLNLSKQIWEARTGMETEVFTAAATKRNTREKARGSKSVHILADQETFVSLKGIFNCTQLATWQTRIIQLKSTPMMWLLMFLNGAWNRLCVQAHNPNTLFDTYNRSILSSVSWEACLQNISKTHPLLGHRCCHHRQSRGSVGWRIFSSTGERLCVQGL